MVVVSLYVGRQVLIPITLAALLSFVLAPLVHVLRRLHLGRVGSVLVAMLAALGIFILLSGLIGTQIASLADDIPRYRTTIDRKVQAVETLASRGMATLLRSYARSIQGVSASSPTPPAPDPVTGQTPVKPTPVQIQDPQPTPFLLAQRVLTPILGPLSSAGIILIVALFLLLQQEDLRDRMIRLFGSRDLHRTTLAIDDAAQRLSRYFLTQLGINTAFGIVICIGLALIGVPSPILWGVIAALLRFVPYIGSPIAAVLPLALAAAVAPGWSLVIATASLFLVVEMLVGQVVEPMMYSNSTGLSPFSVIVAAIFWSWLWGPIGLILSTPVTLCLVVLGRHVQRLEFLDVLLGRPPGAEPGGKLLPAHAGGRSRRGAGPRRAATARPRPLRLLRRGGAQRHDPGRQRRGPRRAGRRQAHADRRRDEQPDRRARPVRRHRTRRADEARLARQPDARRTPPAPPLAPAPCRRGGR